MKIATRCAAFGVFIVAVAGGFILDFVGETQLLPVAILYGIRFVAAPLIWALLLRNEAMGRFSELFESFAANGRIIVGGVLFFLVCGYVGFVVAEWPVPRRGIPTAESRGIVAPLSPSIMLPAAAAGIKELSPKPDGKRDERRAPPTELPPRGPKVNADSIVSSPVPRKVDEPITPPAVQSQAAPSNEPPRVPASPKFLRIESAQ
jgi:hypothetical protein